jgi:hypothetical protein
MENHSHKVHFCGSYRILSGREACRLISKSSGPPIVLSAHFCASWFVVIDGLAWLDKLAQLGIFEGIGIGTQGAIG